MRYLRERARGPAAGTSRSDNWSKMDRYSSNVWLGPASDRSISWLYGFLSSREMNDSEQGYERAVIARVYKKMCQAGFIMFVTVLSMAGRGSIRFCALISTMCLYEIGRLVKLVWAKIPATQCSASAKRETTPADSFYCNCPIRCRRYTLHIALNIFPNFWYTVRLDIHYLCIVEQKTYYLFQNFHELYMWMVVALSITILYESVNIFISCDKLYFLRLGAIIYVIARARLLVSRGYIFWWSIRM